MATLKISELSVGDWVQYRDRELQVCSLYQFTGEVGLWRKDSQICENVADCKPIPITAEILEANGFVRGKRGGFYYYLLLDKNRTLYIHASTNGWRVEITYDAAGILRTTHLMPDMNSVHDIQHALRLAGVDKEINL